MENKKTQGRAPLLDRIVLSKKLQITLLISVVAAFVLIYSGLKFIHAMDVPIFQWENTAYKIRSNFVTPPPAINDMVIVEVDDESLWRIHKSWSFPRDVHAKFLNQLSVYKPALVPFQFMFIGNTKPEEDRALARAIRDAKNVILADRLTVTGDYLTSEPDIQSAALTSGIISKPREADNSIRRSYTYFASGQKPLAALSSELMTYLLQNKFKPGDLKIESNKLGIPVATGGEKEFAYLPLMDFGTSDINYKVDKKYFQKVPYWRVLYGDVDPKMFKDKTVLVGITSRILLDIHQTPLGRMSGVYANAHNLLMLATQDFLYRIPEYLQIAFLLMMGLLGAWMGYRKMVFRAIAMAAGALVLFCAASAFLFWNDWMWDFFGPMLILIASFSIARSMYAVMTFLENQRVSEEAVTDPLTHLYTRRFLEAKMAQELGHAAAGDNRRVSILMTDVDHFKSVNDAFGHDEGDRVLIKVADALKQNATKNEFPTRYGGEEFCVILLGMSKAEALKEAEKFRKAVEKSVLIEKNGKFVRNVTISVGLASSSEDGIFEFLPLVKAADLALYQSKEGGRNRVTAYQKSFGDIGKSDQANQRKVA